MALTTAVEMELKNATFLDVFKDNRRLWLEMAERAYNYTAQTMPNPPRRDDVAPHLALELAANDEFLKIRTKKRVKQKRWIDFFADLIVDRLWDDLAGKGAKKKGSMTT